MPVGTKGEPVVNECKGLTAAAAARAALRRAKMPAAAPFGLKDIAADMAAARLGETVGEDAAFTAATVAAFKWLAVVASIVICSDDQFTVKMTTNKWDEMSENPNWKAIKTKCRRKSWMGYIFRCRLSIRFLNQPIKQFKSNLKLDLTNNDDVISSQTKKYLKEKPTNEGFT